MDIKNNYVIRNFVFAGLKVKQYEKKFECSDYMYCRDNNLDYDKVAHEEIGYQLDAYKSLYISYLEAFVDFYCENNDIDLEDLKSRYLKEMI